MKFLFTLITLCLGTNMVQAQILNFEKYRKPGDPEVQKAVVGELSLDFSLNNRSLNREGETDLYIGSNIASDLGYFIKNHAFYVFGDLVYSAVGDQAITSTGFLHLRTNLWRNRLLSYEIFSQGQFDEARGLNQRFLAGSGLRLKLTDTDRTKIAIGAGLMLEKEKWGSISKTLIKSTNYISLAQAINERMQVSAITYYQTGYDPAIEAFRNRISGELTIKAQVYASFSYTTSFFIFYDDRPIIPNTKTVFSLSNGFAWSF
ncbi:MAG: DUF481 domain-containing protein [Balneolaceae bacterium]